ncbi:hypothetical protein [Brevundimonas sp.]|uniref:hypothetical protein n=1 Tax=Brevundimonas sp. TaxID=1871086 RepID=UPI002D3B8A5E|nr:hypothetical protein [Brevundimonas sp.]HYD29227.1 hypothetical protein [Brevundimonas sp.]
MSDKSAKKTSSGLAAWQNRRPAAGADPAPPPAAPAGDERLVPVTIRFTEEQHRRVAELARATPGKRKRTASVQELVIEGLSRLFAERGLPPL